MTNTKILNLLASLSFCTLTASADTLIEWTFENAADPGVNQTFSEATTPAASGITVNAPVAGANRIDITSTLAGTNSRKTLSVSDVTNAGGAVALGDTELQLSPFLIQGVWPNVDPVFDDDYLEFEVSPDAGKEITDVSLSFDVRLITGSDTVGGLNVGSEIFYSTNGGSSWASAGEDATLFSTAGFNNVLDTHTIALSNITQDTLIRIALSDTSSASAAFADPNTRKAVNLDNIRLEGTIIPEPSLMGIGFGLAALFCCHARRKKD